ncbi:alpha/beta hydrolase [Halobium salinum]|uniref:Alpha/beta hydrolase n=1 Tax=Halobium salinum TaxID=1364940 RepID=A0ABD5P9G6_9EURY|nr:alpha/beta hydrolase [Halobium salinum]
MTDPTGDGTTEAADDGADDGGATDHRREDVLVPGARDVRATLDARGGDACVVACPPHPQHRGHRGDERLVAVSDAAGEAGIDCLRFDYGDWDEGAGERVDARNAAEWATERYDRVALFGFSFGGTLALVVGGERDDLAAVAALAPAARISDEIDAVDGVARLAERGTPTRVVYAERDDTADWEPVVDAARERGVDAVGLPADHFFVGQSAKVGERVGEFLVAHLSE